jgi:hypothetical protein
MERPFTPIDADGGNVKVVVRVRKFLQRGIAHCNNDDGGFLLTQ